MTKYICGRKTSPDLTHHCRNIAQYTWAVFLLLLSRNQRRPLYCRINLSVLDRYFNQQDTRPDFQLSRKALAVLLDLLNQERRHGWGGTMETLVFLFWLASGAS
ncbi:hypothetical protein N1851_015762 [Merluccius polli]|uniref:Uncharacterized protein n=1 Tax=Merluccius polli TaxID=89951 RepID=A0AA47P027_MERPO|nr:hypothetical protein N1851_015762 [Merluccius polli]